MRHAECHTQRRVGAHTAAELKTRRPDFVWWMPSDASWDLPTLAKTAAIRTSPGGAQIRGDGDSGVAYNFEQVPGRHR